MPDPSLSAQSTSAAYDETHAFICAAKGEPYTREEWEQEVHRLQDELVEAFAGRSIAREHGVCLPARFSGSPLHDRRVALDQEQAGSED